VIRAVDLVCEGSLVERLRRHVEAVGPGDRADLGVEAGLGEEGEVGERLGYAPSAPAGEVDVAAWSST
jgi:hypothetical protein